MPDYTVTVVGRVYEYYEVEADSEEEAMDKWADGTFVHSEAFDCEATGARLDD